MYAYTMSVTLEVNNSFAVRKLLHENGFSCFLINRILGQVDIVHEDYTNDVEKIAILDPDGRYSYHCLYNGRVSPDHLFKYLQESEAVIGFDFSASQQPKG